MGRGAGTQAFALDLGSTLFISHVTVDTLNQVKAISSAKMGIIPASNDCCEN